MTASSSGSEPEAPLAAGPAIARLIGLAADLALLTARTAGRADLAQRARELAAAAEPLAAEDAAAYVEFLRRKSDEARARTIELPLEMAALAADVAELAAETSARATGPVGGDAAVGTMLAETAARAAAYLVRVNGGGEAAGEFTSRAAAAAARV
jgi:methenyltetrahydrofolate cyclohydrolase